DRSWGGHELRYASLFALVLLAGCATKPMAYVRSDGQRISSDPVLSQQFELDKTVCLGERQKADLSGVTVANGSLAGAIAAQERSNSANAVARGCMAQKGYQLVPEEQAEERLAENQTVAAEKARREAAAAAPAPKTTRASR